MTAPNDAAKRHPDPPRRGRRPSGARRPADPLADRRLRRRAASPRPPTLDAVADRAVAAFHAWQRVPAPRRGELVRLLGEELRASKDDLARLVTLEAGKIISEGLGEVQEMIDICDFAVGLSRQLYGLTMRQRTPRPPHARDLAAARAGRRHLGLQLPGRRLGLERGAGPGLRRSGDLEAVGEDAADRPGHPGHLRARRGPLRRRARRACPSSCIGGREVGEALAADPRVPLVSATGSTRMGRAVGHDASPARLGRSLLELGGNNAMIVTPTRRPRHGRARHRLLRRRHLRPALHHPAPPARAREHRRRPDRAAARRLRDPARSAIRARTAPWSAR